MDKKFTKHIPWLPVSALIFYLSVLLLWQIGILPSPLEIVGWLESLYKQYGLAGLAIGSFLEGIVYLGLYFPGGFIIFLSAILSDGSFISLFSISLVVAITLTITSLINYVLGKHIISRKRKIEFKREKIATKGLFLSALYPNSLAFYFFHAGIERQTPLKILIVPLIMLPYGLLLAFLFYLFRNGLRSAAESPIIMIAAILIWLVISLILSYGKKKKFNRFIESFED